MMMKVFRIGEMIEIRFLDKIALTFFAIWIGLTVNAHAVNGMKNQ